MGWYEDDYPTYVSVAERQAKAQKEVKKLIKQGLNLQPVVVESSKITNTFWGTAWSKNLESYSDAANRLARGRSYVRSGSVIDLQLAKGVITALVSGSSIYKIKIEIAKVSAAKWNRIVKTSAGQIDSLIELLQGKFSSAVMKMMTDPDNGLFPYPKEIKLSCSCPDSAKMCKHVAAVLYGVGARLDNRPEELFLLRQVDHEELVAKAEALTFETSQTDQELADSDLQSLFGIEMVGVQKKAVTRRKKNKI